MRLYVLANKSFALVEGQLDGDVIDVCTSLTEAQTKMEEEVNETASYYDEGNIKEKTITEFTATLETKDGYLCEYYIKKIIVEV